MQFLTQNRDFLLIDCPNCTVPTSNLGVCNFCLDYQPPAMILDVADPCWLIANGDRHRVEVMRSLLLETTDDEYAPVQEYIAEHGLVLAAQETFADDRWMTGSVEFSVYTSPAERNSTYAGLRLS